MVTISEKALIKVKELMVEEKKPDHFLRIGVKGGGCSGLSYEMKFDLQKNEDDDIFQTPELEIVVNRKSLLYLFGTELDFSDGLNGKGFHFKNPQATRTCGCGESFAV